jgi:hypothetical protein
MLSKPEVKEEWEQQKPLTDGKFMLTAPLTLFRANPQ